MIFRLIADLLTRIWRWYIQRLVCLHFCKFKQAGSDLKYVHVHILGPGSGGKTGLGHDDHTNTDEDGHVTVSDSEGGITISKEDEETLGLRRGYLGTAYFIEGSSTEECPPGFTRIRCRCPGADGPADMSVCYTMEHEIWEGWYEGQKFPDHTGNFVVPNLRGEVVTDSDPGVLECGDSIVLLTFAHERVPDCRDHQGPNAGDNSTVREARRKLQVALDKIGCASGCSKSHSETFTGWKCTRTSPSGPFLAKAAVQWTVRCNRP